MVVSLSFVHPKGANVAGRYWPHTGHLGLTPLSVSGVIRVRKESDPGVSSPYATPLNNNTTSSAASSSSSSSSRDSGNPLRAAAVTVSLRCYEARLGRVGVVRTNVLFEHTVPLWSASSATGTTSTAKRGPTTTPEGVVVADLPQTDFPFNITIPPASAGGCSTCHLQSYRVYWRIESTIHSPQAQGYGSRVSKAYDVAITRYDDPSKVASSSTAPASSPYHPYPHGHGHRAAEEKSYISNTIPISSHPHILALTTYRPQHAVGPLENFGMTFALTVRRPASPTSSTSSSGAGSSTNERYNPNAVVPLKVVASIKRVVEVFDNPEDANGKGKSSARGTGTILSRGPSASASVTSSGLSTPSNEKALPVHTREHGHGHGSKASPLPAPPPIASPPRGSGLPPPPRHHHHHHQRPPTAPTRSPVSALAVQDDKHARHKSLTMDMERQLYASSISKSPSSPPHVTSATSSSDDSSEAESDADDDDGEAEADSSIEHDIDAMDLDPPSTSVPSVSTAPTSAASTPPTAKAFGLFDKRLLWSSKGATTEGSEEKEKKRDKSSKRAATTGGEEDASEVHKTPLFTESASFPRSPMPPSPPCSRDSSPQASTARVYPPRPQQAQAMEKGSGSEFTAYPGAGAGSKSGVEPQLSLAPVLASTSVSTGAPPMSSPVSAYATDEGAQRAYNYEFTQGAGALAHDAPPPYSSTTSLSPAADRSHHHTLPIAERLFHFGDRIVPASALAVPASEKTCAVSAQLGGDTYATTVNMHVPTPKSNHHWATGETLSTGMARIRFVVGCKITLTTPNGGTEVWKAPEIELLVSAVDDRARTKILSEYEASLPSHGHGASSGSRHHHSQQRQQLQQQQTRSRSRSPGAVPYQSMLISPIDDNARMGRTLSAQPAPAQRRRLSPSPTPPYPVADAPPRDSTESALSTASSFVTVSATAPSAPNGGGNGSNGKLSFFERRSARKTPPPPSSSTAPLSAGAVQRHASATASGGGSGRPSTSSSSSSRRTARPRTASGVVTVPGASASPAAVSGVHAGVATPSTTESSGTGSGIGMRRRRLSLSPPPPVRPSPSAASSPTGPRQSSSASPYSPVSPSTTRPPHFFPTTIPAGARSLKLDVERDTMRAWEEELDRIAVFSKRRSVMPGSAAGSSAAGAGRPGVAIGQ